MLRFAVHALVGVVDRIGFDHRCSHHKVSRVQVDGQGPLGAPGYKEYSSPGARGFAVDKKIRRIHPIGQWKRSASIEFN